MYQVNTNALETALLQRFNSATALSIAILSAEVLAQSVAWVEISPEEFSRRCGGFFTEGEHVYHTGPHKFKSKQLWNGEHKFFIYLNSKTGIPLKGWFKRLMYRVRRDHSVSNEDGSFIFEVINNLIKEDIEVKGLQPEPLVAMQQPYNPRSKQFNAYPQGWQ